MKTKTLIALVLVALALTATAALALEVNEGSGAHNIDVRSAEGIRVEWQRVQEQKTDVSYPNPDDRLPPAQDPDHVYLWPCERPDIPGCPTAVPRP